MKNNKEQQVEFTPQTQRLFLRMMLTKPDLYTRVQNIISPENFSKELRKTVEFMMKHGDEFMILPSPEQIHAVTGEELEPIDKMHDGHSEWFLKEFETFTKREELHRAIFKSVDLLENHEFGPVEKLIKDAVQISLQRDLGLDYFADPRGTLMKIKSSNGQMSTGWPSMDKKLYGGFNRGELQIFAGGSGSGKSLFMQNLAVNWMNAGLNGVYISLELSEELCGWRIMSMMTDTIANNIFKEDSLRDVETKIATIRMKTHSKFRIKALPAQSNVNDIRAYIKTLQIETGAKIDFVCVDYLDLLMPVTAKVSPSDLFVKDKYVSEELRNLAKELNVLLVTASQLNRSAVEEVEFDHSHISGGISKINTADNVFGIFTSRAMKERGEYQLQLMKTRSSSGSGSKITLRYDVGTMRITDDESDNDDNSFGGGSSGAPSVLSRIKTQSSVRPSESTDENTSSGPAPFRRGEPKEGFNLETPQPKVVANVQGNKLKSLLGTLKSEK